MHLQENNFFPYSYDIYMLNLFEIVFFLYIYIYIYIVSYCKVVALSLVLLIHVFTFVSDFFFLLLSSVVVK
jgi:hypothetical protein